MGRRLLQALGVLVGLGVLAIGAPAGWVRWQARDRIFSAEAVPERPVALVLGAQVYPSGNPSPYLKARLDLALQLFNAGKVRAILVSGDNGTEHYDEPDAMRKYLIAKGVPAIKVVADYAGFDTYDSCVRAQKIFGVSALTVVTQEYHLYRAVAICQAIGLDVVGVGDTSVAHDDTWRNGELREYLANLKMVWDLVTSRTPTMGPHEIGIETALAAG